MSEIHGDQDQTTTVSMTAPDSGRQINLSQLVMAVAFLAMVAIWGLLTTDTVSVKDLRWLLPIPFLSAGAVGLVASLTDVRRR